MGGRPTLAFYLKCFIIMEMINVVYSRFLSGTISWVPDMSTNLVRVTYRMSWEKGTGPCGPDCSPAQIGNNAIGTVTSRQLSSLYWKYTEGNTTKNLSDVNYYVTSVSRTNLTGWEQGENSLNITLMNNLSKIFFDSIPWVRSKPDNSFNNYGYMETKLDLRVRNDTGKPNSSPSVSVPAFIGVGTGYSTRIQLSADDPDGDIVRCRWAETSECGQACTDVPNDAVKLFKNNCTFIMYSFIELGLEENSTYRIAITVEDFPHGLIHVGGEKFTRKRPLSSIPVQFTIKTTPLANKPYSGQELFLNPFNEKFYRNNLRPSNIRNGVFFATTSLGTPAVNMNSTEIMASVPKSTTYYFDNKKNLNGILQIRVSLKPEKSQYGQTQFCFWLLRTDGLTTKVGCKFYAINDDAQCDKNNTTCQNNGTCVNLYNVSNDICNCHNGYKPQDCSEEVNCDDAPCANKGHCVVVNGSKSTCSCKDGFNGYYCEQEINYCDKSPCRNNATCLDLQNGFKCLCSSNFTGEKCQDAANKIPEKNGTKDQQAVPAWVAALAAIGGLLAVVGLGVCIYLLKSYRPTRTKFISHKKSKRMKPKKVEPVTDLTVTSQIKDPTVNPSGQQKETMIREG